MLKRHGGLSRLACGALAGALLLGGFAPLAAGQTSGGPTTRGKSPVVATQAAGVAQTQVSEADVATVREQLMELLRISPKLRAFVARDASLLGDREYVARNNPELARFLDKHPEVAQNPEFYLFAEVGAEGRRTRFERRDWQWEGYQPTAMREITNALGPVVALATFLGALMWLLRVLLENRRWGRIFKLQTEVHNKLLDKFGTSEDLLTYMRSDPGKRFLEAAPLSVSFEPGQKLRGAVGRILIPLQAGVVVTLLGAGFYSLRGQVGDANDVMLVFGNLALALGIGLMISAGISWALAKHLGLLPKQDAQASNGQAGTQ